LDGWILIQAGARWKWQQGAFTLSCDPERIQWDCVLEFLRQSLFGPGITTSQVASFHLQTFVEFQPVRGPDQIGYCAGGQ